MKRLSMGCGVLVLLLVAFVSYRVLTMRRLEPRLESLPPIERERRIADANKLVKEVEGVAKKVKNGEKGAWTLVASGEQLNTLLQSRIKIEGVPIQNLGVALDPGEMSVNGTTKYKGFDVPMELSGTVETPNGELQFQVDSLTMGGFPIGGGWKERVQKAITKGLKSAIGKSDAKLDSVVIEKDKLTVKGHNDT